MDGEKGDGSSFLNLVQRELVAQGRNTGHKYASSCDTF